MQGPTAYLLIPKNGLVVVSGSATGDGPEGSEHLPDPPGPGWGHD